MNRIIEAVGLVLAFTMMIVSATMFYTIIFGVYAFVVAPTTAGLGVFFPTLMDGGCSFRKSLALGLLSFVGAAVISAAMYFIIGRTLFP